MISAKRMYEMTLGGCQVIRHLEDVVAIEMEERAMEGISFIRIKLDEIPVDVPNEVKAERITKYLKNEGYLVKGREWDDRGVISELIISWEL